MDGTSVAHMYKPGIVLNTELLVVRILQNYLLLGGCTLDESQVKKLIQQSQFKTKEVVRLIEEACTPPAERWNKYYSCLSDKAASNPHWYNK